MCIYMHTLIKHKFSDAPGARTRHRRGRPPGPRAHAAGFG